MFFLRQIKLYSLPLILKSGPKVKRSIKTFFPPAWWITASHLNNGLGTSPGGSSKILRATSNLSFEPRFTANNGNTLQHRPQKRPL